MTTVRKKLLVEQPNDIYLKYLEMAIDYKSKVEYSSWHHMSDEELASVIHDNSTHKETYYEN